MYSEACFIWYGLPVAAWVAAVTGYDGCTATVAYAMQIEQSKLLSTAENLGLLATLERLLVTDPGKVTALSIPFFIAAAGEYARPY